MNRRQAGCYINAVYDFDTDVVRLFSAVVFIAMSTYLSIRHYAFQTVAFDLGQYAHAFWMTINTDQFFYTTLLQNSYLSRHFAPINILVVPVYAIFELPVTLLVVKSAVLAASFPVLYRIAKRETDSKAIGGVVVIAFSTSPFLMRAWLFSYQEQVFAPVLIFAAYGFFQERRWKWFTLTSTLVLLINEFVALLYICFLGGLLLSVWLREDDREMVRKLALIIAGSGFYIVLAFVLMKTIGTNSSSLEWIKGQSSNGESAGLSNAIIDTVRNPGVMIHGLLDNLQEKAIQLAQFASISLYLAFYDLTFVAPLSLYTLYAWVLATRPVYFQLQNHYSLYLFPFLLIAMVRVLGRFETEQLKQYLARGILVVACLGLLISAGFIYPANVPSHGAHTDSTHTAIESIPDDASVVSQGNLVPHLTDRNEIYLNSPPADKTPEYAIISNRTGAWFSNRIWSAYGKTLQADYEVVFQENDVTVYKLRTEQ